MKKNENNIRFNKHKICNKYRIYMNTNFKDMIQLSKKLFPAATFFLTKFQKNVQNYSHFKNS